MVLPIHLTPFLHSVKDVVFCLLLAMTDTFLFIIIICTSGYFKMTITFLVDNYGKSMF